MRPTDKFPVYQSMNPHIDIAEKAKTDAMDAMDKALSG